MPAATALHMPKSSTQQNHSRIEELQNAVAQVFQDSQASVASHRKQIVVLKQIQLKSNELDLEESFNRIVMNMLNRVLSLKKSETVGDRIIKFIYSYCLSILQDDQKQENSEERSLYCRFVDELVLHSMKGIEASNKNVRYRCLRLLSHLLFVVDEISNDIYETLMELLSGRLHDKDPLVRSAAIRAMSRFQENDENDKDDQVSEATEKLLIAIQNDPSADVRKTALLALEKNKITLNYLLERARDVNVINRRLVFSKIVRDIGDFRTIDFRIREKILAWGLKDRESSVSNAAARMFAFNWFKTCDDDLMELIGRLHVIQSDIAETAIKVFFQQRPEIFQKINFSEELWKSLNPESAFLIRCYYQYCNDKNFINSIDKNFPEAMELATLLSKYLKLRKMFLDKKEDETNLESLEFVIQQLLIVAKDYDFSDEVGRREIFQVLRTSLTNDFLSDKLVKELLKVLRKISISERDFCQMITEVVTDIRDSPLDELEQEEDNEDEEVFHSALSDIADRSTHKEKDNSRVLESSSKKLGQHDDDDDAEKARPTKKLKLNETKVNEVTLQCLIITKRMLELLTEPLKELFAVQSLYVELIKPSIHNPLIQIRSLAVQCLGLVCLIDKGLSAEEMFLLGMLVSKGEEELKVIALKVIFDILSVHGTTGVLDIENGVDSLSLSVLLYKCLKDSSRKEAQSVTAIGICKLYLADILIDNELFETLLLSYFGPDVSDNEAFKQALSFCIPVYSFSHPTHQEKVMKIASDTFVRAYQLYYGELENEEKERMTSPAKILEQMIHFTDPSNVVNQTEEQIRSSTIHVKLGIELVDLANHEMFSDDKLFKKVVLSSLMKLKFTAECSDLELLQTLMKSMEECERQIYENPTGYDSTAKNGAFKFKLHLEEIVNEAEKIAENALKMDVVEAIPINAEETKESIDLEKLVEEEIERSMILPNEDEDEEEDEEENEAKHEEEEEGEEEKNASDILQDVYSMDDDPEVQIERTRRSRRGRGNSRRKLLPVADSSIIEDSDTNE